jgi:hypothetical protein
MSMRLLTIGFASALGIVAPFALVKRILDLVYAPDLAGTAPPLPVVALSYLLAFGVALAVFTIAARAIRNDRTSAKPGELTQTEELPE